MPVSPLLAEHEFYGHAVLPFIGQRGWLDPGCEVKRDDFVVPQFQDLGRFAIACMDKLPRMSFDRGTICQIVPHTQLQTALEVYFKGGRSIIAAFSILQSIPSHLVKSERLRSFYEFMTQENGGRHGKSQRIKIILIVVLAVAATPFVMNRFGWMDSFVGTDDQAEAMIGRIRPDYQPWFNSIFEPGENEEWLFALQAAIGVGVFSYCLIKLNARRKTVDRDQRK